MSKLSDEQIIKSIQHHDKEVVKQLYVEYRTTFVAWANARFKASQEDVLDAFQEAVIVFYQNVAEGKIEKLESSIKTYLFSIGKYQLMGTARKLNPVVNLETLPEVSLSMDEVMQRYELSHQETQLKSALLLLSKNCRKILTYFYYNGFDMQTIANRLEYKNADVVKSKKRTCLVKLKDIFKAKFSKDIF